MTTTFKNIILAGAVLSTVIPVGYGAAQASPDFGSTFPPAQMQFVAGRDLTAIRARSFAPVMHVENVASGHFSLAKEPMTFGRRDPGALTNVIPPAFRHTAAKTDNQAAVPSMRSALADISVEAKPVSLESLRPLPMRGSAILVSSGAEVHNGRENIWKVYESGQNSPARYETITVSSVPVASAKILSSDTAADYSGIEAVYPKTSATGITKHMPAKVNEALNAKLDAKHLKPATERADLAKYGCVTGSAGTNSG